MKKLLEINGKTDSKCLSCGKNQASEGHTCPFQEDHNKNELTYCNCCAECTIQCAKDD